MTAATLAVVALGASGCAPARSVPADSQTARVSIDGQDTSATYDIACTQRSWLWTIDTLPAKKPGFTAMVETGGTLTPRLIRLRDLHGFTGSSTGSADIQASIDGSTFTISGTANGSFADRPVKPATVKYRVEARC